MAINKNVCSRAVFLVEGYFYNRKILLRSYYLKKIKAVAGYPVAAFITIGVQEDT